MTLWLWYDPSNVSQYFRRLYDMDEPIRNVCIYYLAGSSFRTLLIWYVTWYELTSQNAVFPFLCPYMVFRVLVSQNPHYHTTSRRRHILWWYHIGKYRGTRGNRSELALLRKSPRCHVNKFVYITLHSLSIFPLAKSLHLILKIIAIYLQIRESGLIAQRMISKPAMTNYVPCNGVFVVIFFKTI